MAIPGDALSTPALPSRLLTPDDVGRPLRTEDYELGGIALSDPTQGLQVQNWRARLVGDEIRISPAPYDVETVLITDTGITELSLAFDQNMKPVLAYMAQNQAKLWWYDSLAGEQVTTILPAGVRSPYLAMDDKRDFANGSNDVILAYIIGNRLCTRQQRDRYNIETTRKWFVGNAVSIRRMGMSAGLRLQFELVGLQNRPLARPYLAGWSPTVSQLNASSISVTAPTGVKAGDLLYAAVVHRSALTVPGGWTLRRAEAMTNGTGQTLSVLSKNTVGPADSGATLAFSVASLGFVAAAAFVVRGEALGVTQRAVSAAVVNSTATNAITAQALNATLLAGELHVLVASSINAQGITTTPVMPAGATLVSGSGPNMRLAIGYQLRDLGQSIAGNVTFDNGTPTSNGLVAITLAFGVPP
jgi:hypothetical protein